MTETNTGPELETPEQQGSSILGVLGAFLGALLGHGLWLGCMFALPSGSVLWDLIIFGGLFAGFFSCWGYRLFRGRRNMKFAWRVVRLCVMLAVPAAIVLCTAALVLYWAKGWWAAGPQVVWLALTGSVERLVTERDWKPILILSLISLFLARISAPILLKYADPGWYNDPRRAAQSNGGGAMFNYLKGWPGISEPIPHSFTVDKGKITVEGEQITAKGRWGKVTAFGLREVAGVVIGPGSGFNVLYDKEKRVLAKFAWSRKGADLFGQYLLEHGVPFEDLQGQKLDLTPQKVELPWQFEVRESKVCLWVGVICLVLFSVLSALCLFVMDELAILIALLVFLFFVLLSAWLLLSYKNRRLVVEGNALTYTTAFGRTTRFRVDEVDSFRYRFGRGTRELRDREGKLLARFEDNMEGAALLVEYLIQHMNPHVGQ